jgi:GT2 family glycosyltransferase
LKRPLSLVVLTYNRAPELLRTLQRSLALPEHPAVIVVDNGSRDGTAAMVRARFPQVRLISLPFNIGAAARNAGVARAQTAYVAFSDDDTAWVAESLTQAADLLDRYPRLAAVTARVLVGPEEREDPVSAEMAASPLPDAGLPGPALLGFLAGASVFRREAFVEAGGYEPRLFLGGEETLLSYALAERGWLMMYAPQLTVHHYPSRARDGVARRRMLMRNALWVTWLRRPLSLAVRRTWALRSQPRVLRQALQGAIWVLRARRPLPASVEAQCQLLDAAHDTQLQVLLRAQLVT